jgi:hypothetical protein
VYKREGNAVEEARGAVGEVVSELAEVNCSLWHEQEKVYDFESVPADQKDAVVKKLALLNLQRNNCIDRIDRLWRSITDLVECVGAIRSP